MSALLELTKPGITRLVVVTAAAGFLVAAPDHVDVVLLAHALVGTALVAGGTNALNQWWERDADARMRRTRRRPLPSGRLTPGTALGWGAALAVAGIGYLALFVNAITAGLALASLASYVLVYTPLKRRTSLATLVGAVPGALPILGGWAAAGGGFTRSAAALFAILFLWQIPHFLALGWLYRDDYRAGGFAMLSRADPHGLATGRLAVTYSLLLLIASLLPALLGLVAARGVYAAGAVTLGVALLGWSWALLIRPSEGQARSLFRASIIYLPALLTLLVGTAVVA